MITGRVSLNTDEWVPPPQFLIQWLWWALIIYISNTLPDAAGLRANLRDSLAFLSPCQSASVVLNQGLTLHLPEDPWHYLETFLCVTTGLGVGAIGI